MDNNTVKKYIKEIYNCSDQKASSILIQATQIDGADELYREIEDYKKEIEDDN